MEGASVALVCDALKVPCFILRAMSDKAGKRLNLILMSL